VHGAGGQVPLSQAVPVAHCTHVAPPVPHCVKPMPCEHAPDSKQHPGQFAALHGGWQLPLTQMLPGAHAVQAAPFWPQAMVLCGGFK
jgi:hypothetical protein